jgi:hypothetical protein
MRKFALVAFMSVLCIGLAAWKADAQVRGNQYSMAGCGLGSLVFRNDEDRTKQVLAATTNGTFGSQTFGITTGTLNCNPGGGPSGRTASLFIDVNREAFVKDVSRGNGETIEHLATIMGCSNSAAVGTALQKNFGVIFTGADTPSDQITDNVFQTIKQDPALAGSCTSIS